MSYTPSVRELALRAIKAALSGEGTPAANTFRSKLDTFLTTDLPFYDITPDEEKVEDPGEFGDRFHVTRTLTVFVRAVVDAARQEGDFSAQSPQVDDSALDPFYIFAVQQLAGGTANLGEVVLDVAEASEKTVFQPGGHDVIGLEMTFEVKFATKRGDPTQKG